MLLHQRELDLALTLWPESSGGTARLINLSENQIYLIERPNGGRFVLRVHRPGYQSWPAITSELSWVEALRANTDVPLGEPVRGNDGELLQAITTADGDVRHLVLFRFVEGREPMVDTDLSGLFSTLGGYAAHLHTHAINWARPQGFERPVWDGPSILDADGLWGNWRIAPGVTASISEILQQLDRELRLQLLNYGNAADRFGLIHSDMRLGNLLVDGEAVTLIDFDDCGFCWFVYDFAASVSFHETHPSIPGLKARWLEGYRAIRTLSDQDIAMIDTMIMLRRMALLAWIGSHNETQLAQTHMPGFAQGTADLAERYLSGQLFPK